ncbi:MAG: D-alanyl-D-alanine endopeptidase [Burkholderiales bacterium]|nr:D-alanyl-D-alanine endopeptidase [Burkholderiales bacterium]
MTGRFLHAIAASVLVAAASAPVAAREPARAAADGPRMRSAAVLVMDQETREVLYSKNEDAVVPIASITKLMTALVTLDASLPLDEEITITKADLAIAGGSRARSSLRSGVTLTRRDLLRLALMSSENRAAAALGRSYPGGLEAFVEAMNARAQLIGMSDSRFIEPTGLSPENVSSAGDLVRLVEASARQPLIREYSTASSHEVRIGKRKVAYRNTNRLVSSPSWAIGVQKTGFIRAAGRCLVMQANIAARPLVIVLLDSVGKYTRIGDANRLRTWLEDSLGVEGADGGVRRPDPVWAANARTAYDSGSRYGSRVRVQFPSPTSYW